MSSLEAVMCVAASGVYHAMFESVTGISTWHRNSLTSLSSIVCNTHREKVNSKQDGAGTGVW
ncbi:hypothetical protein E2C01_009409 [Portunus trituberculatus]|uniref:Uncharacterized protein n=1 Tax=Portunus trituberculatus TaxID=210409 RepID=A0A5B7D4I7_PORTR|nr:hypothetical protein [Portunus trituberculatus]